MLGVLAALVGATVGAGLSVIAKKFITGINPQHPASQPRLVLVGCLVGAVLFRLVISRFSAWDERVAYAALGAGLVTQTMIDALTHRLVRSITYAMAIVGVVLLGVSALRTGASDALWSAAICAGLGWLIFVVANKISPGGVGSGDVRLVPVLGWYLGFLGYDEAVGALFVAFTTASLVGITLIAMDRGSLRGRLAFGPYLAFGTLVGVFAGGIFPTLVVA